MSVYTPKNKFKEYPMKKFFAFVLLLLALTAFSACQEGECEHYKTTEKITEPTCTEEGYTLRKCKECGYEYKFRFVEPLGHELDDKLTEATCTKEGYITYTCSRCDYEYVSNFSKPKGHQLTSAITASTCTEGGYTTYTCGCGYTYKTKFTVPNGHHLVSKVTAPKCADEGYTTYSCACGYSFVGDYVEPTGHNFKKAVTRPSIATTGHTEFTCKTCDFSYKTDYVWYSEIFSGAEGDGDGALAYGIDLSYWNKNVDFDELKDAGIDFVILRAGSVNQQPDYNFEKYYKAAREAGLDVGCYFYSYAETVAEAREEAEILLELIDGKKFEYPVYFDMEDDVQTDLSTERRMKMCYAFCEILIENGYFPGVYANLKWLNNYFDSEELCTYFDVWYARYPLDASDGSDPIYFEDWDYELPEAEYYGMWQFTQSGRIDGASGNVDLNIAYKDYPAIMKKYGYNGY